MSQYKIHFVREYYETIVVEAESEREAGDIGLKELENVIWRLDADDIGHEDISWIEEI